MSITYDQLVTLIEDTIQSDDESTFETHIPDFIKQAEDTIIKNCQLPVMTKTVTGSFTTGNEHITLPSDYIAPLKFEVISGNDRYQLKHKDASYLSAAFPSSATAARARPLFYSQGDDGTTSRLKVRPIPDTTYSYDLEYSSRPASLTAGAGSGTTWISTNMRTALVYGALMHAALYIVDLELAATYERQFKEAAGLTKVEQESKARDDRRRKDYIRPEVQEG